MRAAALSLLLLALLGGCGGGGGSSDQETATPEATASAQASPLVPAERAEGALGEAVELGAASVLLSNLEDPYPPDPTYPIEADERLVAFDAGIENVGDLAFDYSPAFFTAVDEAAQAIFVPSAGLGTTLVAGEVAPGETVSGRIVFEVASTTKIDFVRYKAYEERDLILINLPE